MEYTGRYFLFFPCIKMSIIPPSTVKNWQIDLTCGYFTKKRMSFANPDSSLLHWNIYALLISNFSKAYMYYLILWKRKYHAYFGVLHTRGIQISIPFSDYYFWWLSEITHPKMFTSCNWHILREFNNSFWYHFKSNWNWINTNSKHDKFENQTLFSKLT